MKKKKLLINIVNLDANGVQIIWLIKFKKLESLGFELWINGGDFLQKISLKHKDVYTFNQSLKRKLDKTSIRIISKFGYIVYVFKKNLTAWRSLDKIRRQKYSVVYSPSSVLDLIIIPFLLKHYDRNLIWVTVFDNAVPFLGTGNKLVRFLAWLFFQISVELLRRADRIFAVTPYLKAYLIRRGFSPDKIFITGNAVEADLISKAKSNRKYKIDALFMGRINEKKGIFDLLEVLKIVRKKMPGFKLGILGQGDKPTEDAFKLRIKKMGLEKNIVFFGYIAGIEKYNLIKSAKVFWFFSHDESFGVALLEAVCCGKPALAYDLPPYREIYKNKEIKTFKFADYRSIAKETLGIFKVKSFKNQAGEKLLNDYRWEKIVATEYNSFKKLLDEKK